MEFLEYLRWDVSINGAYELPNEFFTDEEGIDVENGMKYLISKGLIYNENIDFPEYGEELEREHPGAFRFLNAYAEARRNSLMDKLVEKEYVQAFLEGDKIIYRWTQLGVDKMKEKDKGLSGPAEG